MLLIELSFQHADGQLNTRLPILTKDGRTFPEFVRYMYFVSQRGSNSRTWAHAYAIQRLAIFTAATSYEALEAYWTDFLRFLLQGSPENSIKRLSAETARKYFNYVCEFADWLHANNLRFPGIHPNPNVNVKLSYVQGINRKKLSAKINMLSHLYSVSKAGRGYRLGRKYEPAPRSGITAKRRPRGFSLENFNRLLRHETNPRNLLIWLLLGGCGPRISEALHLFIQDISSTSTGIDIRLHEECSNSGYKGSGFFH